MAKIELQGPVDPNAGPNTRDETPERGWGFKRIIEAANDMFTELYAAVAGFAVSTDAVTLDRALKLPTYTVATAPDAGDAGFGALIAVSDGNAGAECLAMSDGADWKVIALGSTIAAA